MNKRQAKKLYYKDSPYYKLSLSPDFYRCTEFYFHCDGVEVRCRIGLWSVSSTHIKTALHEAFHYWQQYYADGEYNEHLELMDL